MSSPRDLAETDVVVIGSGFGGSAAAHCVASAGQSVLLLERGPWRDSLPVHAGGGACVGPDAEQGVVDHRGEIYGNPGVFVADGAALPTAVGGPPSLAITAWAQHVGDAIARSASC